MSTNRSESINYWRWRGSVPPVNPPQPSLPDDDGPPEPRDLSTTELLQEDFFRKPGIHVIFMPKVEEILKMAESAELCRKISEKFFLPDFFFERLGWNANGIFGSTENLSESDTETSYETANHNSHEATFSRFLSKHIREVRPNRITPRDPSEEYLISSNASSYEYEWHYMAFCTLWRSSVVNSTDEFTDETNVLVCFDLDDNITLRLKRLLQKADLRHWKNEPFLMLEYALKVVVDRCEDDLWSFQKPMRIVEKSRDEGLFQGIGLVGNDKIFEFLVERYSRLHEISRHVIHISETMDAASNNIGAIIRDHDLWIRSSIHSSTTTRRLSKALLLYENIITNLGLRAKALLARMDNEIHCVSASCERNCGQIYFLKSRQLTMFDRPPILSQLQTVTSRKGSSRKDKYSQIPCLL
ncbi:unnamed protein product [Penicillium bialowiezense]